MTDIEKAYAEETVEGRTREEWRAHLLSFGRSERAVNDAVGYMFGDWPGDRIAHPSLEASKEYDRVLKLPRGTLSAAERRAALDRCIDYTRYPAHSPYRRRREREEAERAARGEGGDGAAPP